MQIVNRQSKEESCYKKERHWCNKIFMRAKKNSERGHLQGKGVGRSGGVWEGYPKKYV